MIVCDDFGHIKAWWDNQDKCLRCSSCSRESTCTTSISWSNKIWKLADKRRTYPSRKWVMKKKHNKKQQVLSDHHPTWPAARGRTHPGGNFKGTCTQRSASPRAIGQPATGNSPTGQEDITGQPVPVIVHLQRSNGHW